MERWNVGRFGTFENSDAARGTEAVYESACTKERAANNSTQPVRAWSERISIRVRAPISRGGRDDEGLREAVVMATASKRERRGADRSGTEAGSTAASLVVMETGYALGQVEQNQTAGAEARKFDPILSSEPRMLSIFLFPSFFSFSYIDKIH